MIFPNILIINLEEPTSILAQKSTHHSLAKSPPEAENRYRAIIQVLITQLTGLSDTHVRFVIENADPAKVEAVSFWILPLFRGEISKQGNFFLFTPEQHAPPFTLEFTDENQDTDKFKKSAQLSAHCPQCSSRWINAAMLQCSESKYVIGFNYLTINHNQQTSGSTSIEIPTLPLILTDSDWKKALDSTIGPKLKKTYDLICGNLE